MQELKQPSKKPLIFYYVVIVLVIMLLNATLFPMMWETPVQEVDYTTFMSMTYDDNIGLVQIDTDEIIFTDKAQENFYKTVPIPSDMDLVNRVYEHGGQLSSIDTGGQTNSLLYILLSWILPFLPFLVIGYFLNKRMKNAMGGGDGMMFGMGGNSGAKVYVPSSTGIRFADVAGEDEAKELLGEIVDFLQAPQKYLDLGARIPKGVLLVGPPGTGKTLLAKAVAGEAGVQFLSISGSDFVELYVGVGASRVRDLFEEAKKVAPAVVFIDEIDAVGRQRGAGLGGGHDEREQTLNQLLVEMDGFTSNEGVVVLAATNRADILDPALLRPGRFDRQIYVGRPDLKGREEILRVHARNKPLSEDVDLRVLAQSTPGFSGADLENVINEGALLSARRGQKFITMDMLQEAVVKVIAGPEKKSRVVPPHERRLTAYHEAGHAVMHHCLASVDPVHSVTIIPRGQAGGMTISLPGEDRGYYSRRYMEEEIAALLGGRTAEELFLGDISTGASNDLQRASAMARRMVTAYGMSERLGAVSYDSGHDEVFIGRSMAQAKSYSEEVAAQIDQEVKAIIDAGCRRCREVLEQYREQTERAAQYLLEHETMSGEDFAAVMGFPKVTDPEL